MLLVCLFGRFKPRKGRSVGVVGSVCRIQYLISILPGDLCLNSGAFIRGHCGRNLIKLFLTRVLRLGFGFLFLLLLL